MAPPLSATVDTASADESVPLSWLLARPELGLVAHHVPAQDAGLAWAHPIEIEDPSPWLEGPGLVLTTGLRLPRTKLGQEQYVARLAAAGAVALGFGTGLRFAAIPFAVVGACREHGLALVEVPLPTPFLAVVQAIGDRQGELRRLRLRESLRHQRELTAAALDGGVAAVVKRLARVLRAGIRVVAREGVAWEPRGLGARLSAGAGAPSAQEILRETTADPGRSVAAVEPGRVLEVQPLATGAEVLGWLALGRDRALTPAERVVLSHAVSLITIELAGSPAAQAMPALAAAAVDAVLSGRALTPVELLSAAGPNAAQRCVVVMARGAGAELLLAAAGPADALAGQAGDVVEAVASQGAVDHLVAPLPPSVTVSIGTPTPVEGLPAQRVAVRRLLDRAAPGERARLAGSPVARLLADPALAAAVDPWLAPLRDHDAAHGTDLLAALRAFLHHHQAWDPAAQALGIHRHTMRHRVERAAEVAGFDLADPTHRALLTMAFAADPA